jgi:cbb3-type cytochrome oxidase subunit 3
MYSPGWEEPYLPARKELTSFAVLTIILILLTIFYACVCAHNYKKGLKPYVNKPQNIEDDEKPMSGSAYAPFATEMEPGANGGKMPAPRPNANRMEID